MQSEHPAQVKKVPAGKQRKIGVGTFVAVAILIGITAFVLGARAENWLGSLGGFNSSNAGLQENLELSSLQNVYQKLRQEYDGQLDAAKLVEGAKKGLAQAAGDPYTVYFTQAEAQEFLSDLDGKFSGIGAEIDEKNQTLFIVSTIDDSPARRAGVLADDVIVKVNDEETTGWSIDQAVSKIRGEKGTTVKLTLLRGGQELKEISIVREEIVNPSVKHEITPDNIGIIRIGRFAHDTAGLARAAANEFRQKNVKGVVLDVRGNGGGYLDAAQEVANLWLPAGTVIVEEKRDGKTVDTLRAQDEPVLKGIPTVVLINGGSASASEIVAGALSDHKAATLVGEKTFGKGSVQRIFDAGGGQIKVTVSKWFTPNGKNISKEGIAPDQVVEATDADVAAGRDSQKDRAIERLK